MKTILTLLLSLLFLTNLALAQPYIISNNSGGIGGGGYAGSSFLTLGAGQIDSIVVINRSNQDYTNNTISVFTGNTTAAGSLLHQENIGPVPAGQNTDVKIRFASPVHVNAATTYTFYVVGFPIRWGASNTYANGTYWTNAGEQTGSDLDFTIYIGNITASGINNVADTEQNYIHYKAEERKIEASSDIPADCQLMLFDVQGKKIAFSEGKQLPLPSTVSEGIYIVKLQTGKVVYSRKIYIK